MTEHSPGSPKISFDNTAPKSADWVPIAIFLAPLATLMILGSLLPWPGYDADTVLPLSQQKQMVVLLGVQILLTSIAVVVWLVRYGIGFKFRISPVAVALGVLGVVLWITLARVDAWLVETVGLTWLIPKRPSFNPWQQLPDETWRNLFLAARFLMLAVLVPIAEEVFLRGWLGRWFETESEWHRLPLKNIGRHGLLAIAAYAVLAHPMEAIAATVWFNMVSWHMKRTGSLTDCIVIHATTNLLLGIWIINTSSWHLW